MDNVGGNQYLGGTIQNYDEHCTKYGSDILIISGSYGGHKTTD